MTIQLRPQHYNVKGIPMLMLFKDGEVAATKMGALPPQKTNRMGRGCTGLGHLCCNLVQS